MHFATVKRNLVTLVALVCVVACTKSSEVGSADDNFVAIYSNQVIDSIDSGWQVSAVGTFKNNTTGQLEKVQLLKINNRALSPNPDNTYSYGYGSQAVASPEGLALSGTNVSITVAGTSGADSFTQVIYLPKALKVSATNFAGGSIDATQNQVVNWTPDPGNETGNIVITISYQGTLSRQSDPGLPASMKTVTYTVPDNGSYAIPQAALKAYPNKSYIEIAFMRQTQRVVVLPLSRKKIDCSAVSSASTAPVIVKNQ